MTPLEKTKTIRDTLHQAKDWPAAEKQKGANKLWRVDVLLLELMRLLPTPKHAPAGDALPVFSVTLAPHWLSHQDDAASDYQAAWIYPHSPTVTYRSPDNSKTMAQRYLLLDPRVKDANGQAGCDEWWFIIERMWPSSYPAENHGAWGREFNGHNVAGDAGPDGGIGWSFGAGNSALGLDWLGDVGAPTINIEPAASGGLTIPVPKPARDQWHTYVVHFVAGRTDGSTSRPGAIKVWADGAAFIDKANINTVQRAQGPDGQWYVQRWMQIWEGDYTRDLPVVSTHQMVLTRVGRTLAEAVNDRPVAAGSNLDTMYPGPGADPNLGPSIVQVGTRASSLAKVPT